MTKLQGKGKDSGSRCVGYYFLAGLSLRWWVSGKKISFWKSDEHRQRTKNIQQTVKNKGRISGEILKIAWSADKSVEAG